MKECIKCHKENRDKALYCRFCGEKLQTQTIAADTHAAAATKASTVMDATMPKRQQGHKKTDRLDNLVGLENVKRQVRELVSTINSIVKQRGKSILNSLNTNILITGPSGTGVSKLYFQIGDYMSDEGIYKDEECDVFNPLTIDDGGRCPHDASAGN